MNLHLKNTRQRLPVIDIIETYALYGIKDVEIFKKNLSVKTFRNKNEFTRKTDKFSQDCRNIKNAHPEKFYYTLFAFRLTSYNKTS